MPRRAIIAAAVLSALVAATPVIAQTYPSRTVTIVVPAAAGGGIDITARWLAAELQTAMGQPFLVENKGGASGNIGTGQVAHATPDGYTLLFTISGFLVTNPALFKSLPYDPVKDFAAVSMLLRSPHTFVVNKNFPANTMAELAAYARANPGKLTFGSPGVGSQTHIASLLFGQMANVQVTAVPYRGTGPAYNDLIGGTLGFFVNTTQQLLGPLRGDVIKALAIASSTRHPLLPNVPTMAEAGLPGLEIDTWYALYAPAGTPKEIVDALARQVKLTSEKPEFKKRVEDSGATMDYMTPAELQKYTAQEVTHWTAIIHKLGIEPQ